MTAPAGSIDMFEQMQDQLRSMIVLADETQEFLIAATLSMACDQVDQRLLGLMQDRDAL